MPQRNQGACFSEQEKQNAVDNRQRLFVGVFDDSVRPVAGESREHIGRRVEHAVTKRLANDLAMLLRLRDEPIEAQARRKGGRLEQSPMSGRAAGLVKSNIQLELDVSA